MTERMINAGQAEAWQLRAHLRHDAERAVTLTIWGVYSPAEALEELQGLARLSNILTGRKCQADAVARSALLDEYRRQVNLHADTAERIKRAVLAQIRAKAGYPACAKAAAVVAQSAPLPPPPHVVTDAIEDAAREHRMQAAWWRRQAATG